MKVALVHDYLSQDGGAERVLQAFRDIYPEAPIFVLFHDKKKLPQFVTSDIRQSFISKMPFGKTKYQWYLPWMPLATERHNLHDFDLVLSSTSAFAKGILTRPETLHISYCHSPTRYLWTDTHEYIHDLKYNRFIKAFLPRLIHKLRLWDRASVDRVDHFIANSDTVRHRIQKYYRRKSDIVYPPVDTHLFSRSTKIQNYFISGGRFVPYKRFDLVIQAFNRLGWPLKLFGDGPELARLKKFAKPNIQFIGRVTDERKIQLIRDAKAFIHPQVEDLRITPIESMASGRPVIAYGVGGVTETVIPGVTGLFFDRQDWESLVDVLLSFDTHTWDSALIQAHASKFSANRFKEQIRTYIQKRYSTFLQEMQQCRLDVR